MGNRARTPRTPPLLPHKCRPERYTGHGATRFWCGTCKLMWWFSPYVGAEDWAWEPMGTMPRYRAVKEAPYVLFGGSLLAAPGLTAPPKAGNPARPTRSNMAPS